MKFIKILTAVVICLSAVIIAVSFPQIKSSVLKFMYPQKFSDIISAQADEYSLDINLVYSVIKTESNFQPMASSSAGAKGLMQLTDETFRWMVDVSGTDMVYSDDDLFDPEVNIKYGCMLLRHLLDYYGNIDMALCAYNAGIGNVTSWLNNTKYSEDGETLTDIPFPETKKYVQKVNSALQQYRELYK